MPLIELRRVYKSYRFGQAVIEALRGIDLQVELGEFVAICGPSGSGKSTLCNLIGMLDRPTSGDVLFQGRNLNEVSDGERSEIRNQTLGFVFQSFNLIPVLSALENVMLPLQIQGAPTRQTKEKAIQQMTRLGLGEHLRRRPEKLSGGQQQRVAVARALINNPSLVLADEPTANLDSGTAVMIIDLMRDLNQQTGAAFIFSTHDQRLLERVSRRILLQDGTIVEDSGV
ncbi:MAG: ABC transporter ATP-binding protein [Deltaproteobacteria bacterium]|nr:ABC transporter ATP-binding protein [Deltaproteobacteria bacterium]